MTVLCLGPPYASSNMYLWSAPFLSYAAGLSASRQLRVRLQKKQPPPHHVLNRPRKCTVYTSSLVTRRIEIGLVTSSGWQQSIALVLVR